MKNRLIAVVVALCMLCGLAVTYVSAEETSAADSQTQVKQILLYVGESISIQDINNEYTDDGTAGDVVQVDVAESDTFALGEEITSADQLSDSKQYFIESERKHNNNLPNRFLTSDTNAPGLLLDGDSNSLPANGVWKIVKNGTYYHIYQEGKGYLDIPLSYAYLVEDAHNIDLYRGAKDTRQGWVIMDTYHTDIRLNQYQGGTNTIAAGYNDTDLDGNLWYIYEAITEGSQLTVTGVKEGNTSITVGDTTYQITVKYREKKITLGVGETYSQETSVDSFVSAADSAVASGEISNGQVIFTGIAAGNTQAIVDGVRYSIDVYQRGDTYDQELAYGGSFVAQVPDLQAGETVAWTTGSGEVSLLDASGQTATIVGRAAGQTTVTATVKGANGQVTAVYTWHVTVGERASGTKDYSFSLTNTELTNGSLYYSVNGGPLQELGNGVSLSLNYTGDSFGIYFFGAPKEGYALTYLHAAGEGQFWSLDGYNGVATSPAESALGRAVAEHVQAGVMTERMAAAMLAEAKDLGCAGGFFYTRTGSFTGAMTADTVTVTAYPLPTIHKEIIAVTHENEREPYVSGMKVVLGDTIHYRITITNEATGEDYGYVTYTALELKDSLLANEDIKQPNGRLNSIFDWTHTAEVDLSLTLDNYAECVKDGIIVNTATMECTYSSNFSNGSASFQSTAVADIKVKSPYYVIDFGLPLDISLDKNVVGNMTISAASAKYGTVSFNGIDLTYTPSAVLTDEEFITLTLANADGSTYGYGVWIYPASSVYYEEGFISGWSGGSTGAGKQSALHEELDDQYGHDSVYESVLTGGSQKDSSAPGTNTASFEFTGTGVDIYANCSGATGSVLVMVENANTGYIAGLFQVDTAFKPGTTALTSFQEGSAYGLPIVSVNGLSHGNYKVTIYHVAGAEGNSSAVHLDGFRVYGTLQDQSVYAEDGEAAPMFIQLRDSLLNTMNVAQVQADSQYAEDIAKGIFQQVLATGESLNGAVLLTNDTGITLDNDTLLDLLDNGPKNEIFLQPGYSLVLKVPSSFEVQVGLKAVNGQAAECTLNGNQVSVNSSVDMFYPVTLGEDGSVTITNNSGGMLSITSLKLLGGAQPALGELTADSFVPLLLSAGYESRGSQSCTEHTWGEWTVTQEASVGSQGCREHTCAVCGVTQEENFYMGDLDGDGMVSVVDAMLLRQLIAGWELADINLRATDINGDGRIDAADAMALRMMIANA